MELSKFEKSKCVLDYKVPCVWIQGERANVKGGEFSTNLRIIEEHTDHTASLEIWPSRHNHSDSKTFANVNNRYTKSIYLLILLQTKKIKTNKKNCPLK